MVGYGANKGIVPISCNEIFRRIKETTTGEKTYEVCVSMLEIYNEKVQDLLIPMSERPTQGLKVRESKTLGIFVDGLSKHPVTSYEEIASKMDSGYDHRTIGSTLMNASSSRAHTIVTVEFKQITMVNNKKTEKVSVINLVDLAGSERSSSTGATGDRLKEGCNINKSLLVLGNVINTLADKAMGKQKNAIPPYRDSNLTRILQTALGGNSKTVMICALSPASMNFEETLGTLRYADRAKKIQNKAVVNESESVKINHLSILG
jgi:kinesin family protein 13